MNHTLGEAIALARDTYAQIGSPSPHVRIDPLLRYAERVQESATGQPHTIDVVKADVPLNTYRGMWRRGVGSSTIYVCKHLNVCWTRFVICKEAIHLMIDDSPARRAQSIPAQVQEAFEMRWPTQTSAPLSSELLAVIVAFELLYPWAHRYRIASPPPTMLYEAKKFMIPERYMDAYFRLPFGKLSEQMNDGIA